MANAEPGAEDPQLIKALKSEVRSILISHPNGSMTVPEFLRDYRLNMGKHFPNIQFNFQSPLELLSSLHDVVGIRNTSAGPVLVPLTSEKTEHINELVAHQKKSRTRNIFKRNFRPLLPKSNNQRNSPVSRNTEVKKQSSVPCNTEVKKQSSVPCNTEVKKQSSVPCNTEVKKQSPVVEVNSSKSVEKKGSENCPNEEQSTLEASLDQLNELTSSTKDSRASKINVIPNCSTSSDVTQKNEKIGQKQKTEHIKYDRAINDLTQSMHSWHLSANNQNNKQDSLIDKVKPQEKLVEKKDLNDSRSSQQWNNYRSPKERPPCQMNDPTRISFKIKHPLTPSNSSFEGFNSDTEEELFLPKHRNSRPCPTAMEPSTSSAMEPPTSSSPKPTSISEAREENKIDVAFSCKGETESSSICDSMRQDFGFMINEKVKENFRTLLMSYPSGLSCSKLVPQYKEKFGVPLDILDLGFTSVREMIISLPTVFTFEKQKHSQDWILYDARINPKRRSIGDKWIPMLVVDNLAEVAQAHPDGIPGSQILDEYHKKFGVKLDLDVLGFKSTQSFLISCKSITTKVEGDECTVYPKHWKTKKIEVSEKPSEHHSALPPAEDMKFIWKPYFKDDMCDITFTYKRVNFPFGEKLVKINVSDVFSPSLLWLQVYSSLRELNTMMYSLNTFYDENEDDYILDPCVIKKGLACAVKFTVDNRWHRGLVESVSDDNSTADILYVDYGTRLIIQLSEVRALHKQFGEYPLFAIKASFYNLGPPPDGNGEYPLSAFEFLFNNYTNKPFYVEIVKVDVEEPSLEVILFETSNDNDINVNNLLVRQGYAAKKSRRHHGDLRLDEANVNLFYKLLPCWMYDTLQNPSQYAADAKKALEHCCANKRSLDSLQDGKFCCKRHLLLMWFKAYPHLTIDGWHEVMEKYSAQLEDCFLENMLSTFPKYLPSRPELSFLPPFCSPDRERNPSHEDAKEVLVKQEEESAKKPELLNGYSVKKVPKVEKKYLNNVVKSEQIPTSQPSHMSSEPRPVKPKTSQPPHMSSQPPPVKPKKRSVISSVVMGKSIELISYKNKIYVMYEQIIKTFANGATETLCEHRLQSKNVKLKAIVIDSREPLYDEVRARCGHNIKLPSSIRLIPLSEVSSITSCIAPYSPFVGEVFLKLAEECTPDHRSWYEW